MFLSGYLGLCAAINIHDGPDYNGVSVTEVSAPGYMRQAIEFSDVVNGVTFSSIPYTFGTGTRYGQVGRAIFTAPVPGSGQKDYLLFVLPYATPAASGRPYWEAGDVGHLRLYLPDMAAYAKGSSFTGLIGFEAGLCSDAYDVLNPADLSQVANSPRPLINTAKVYTPNQLRVANGTASVA